MASGEATGVRRYIPQGHSVSWWMLVVTTGAILITSVDRVILPTVLPAILKEFNLSDAQGGFLVSLSFAGTAIGGVVLGTLGDSPGRGPRRAWMWCVSVLVAIVGAVLTGLSRTVGQLQALRIVMGLGTARWSRSTWRWSGSGGRRRIGASPWVRITRVSPSASSSVRS